MSQRFLRSARRTPARRRGAVLILVAFFVVVLLGMAAFAVDIAYVQLCRAQLRAAADAAAKAGTCALRTSQDVGIARAAAMNVAALNTVDGTNFKLNPTDVSFGQSVRQADGSWAFMPDVTPYRAVKIDAKLTADSAAGPVTSFFGRIFGHNSYETQQTAVASQYDQQVVMCLDRSHSMCWDNSGSDWSYPPGVPAPFNTNKYIPVAGSRWNALEKAVGSYIDTLNLNQTTPEVGLVTWSYEITASSPEYSVLNATMAAATIDVPLTKTYATVTQSVQTRGDGKVVGMTNMGAGISKAVEVLQASTNIGAVKSIILMTDGQWNTGTNPVKVAQAAVDAGIVVHTISFLPGSKQPELEQIALMSGGKFYYAADEDALNQAFVELATTLSVVLTQ